METLMKLLLKITDENGKAKWVHLCYIPEHLYAAYRDQKGGSSIEFNTILSRWIKEDFNKNIDIVSAEDFDDMKNLVKAYYKETYPEVYLDQLTDRQGWLRVWVTKKMKEELGIGE